MEHGPHFSPISLARLAQVYLNASREDFGPTNLDLIMVETQDVEPGEVKRILNSETRLE